MPYTKEHFKSLKNTLATTKCNLVHNDDKGLSTDHMQPFNTAQKDIMSRCVINVMNHFEPFDIKINLDAMKNATTTTEAVNSFAQIIKITEETYFPKENEPGMFDKFMQKFRFFGRKAESLQITDVNGNQHTETSPLLLK